MAFFRDWQEFLVQFLALIDIFSADLFTIMRKSKLLFVITAIVFFIILAIIAIDISSRTNFPGQKKLPSEQIKVDSTTKD